MNNIVSKTVILNNGVEIPTLGFGVDRLNGDQCVDSVIKAIESGYRLIDTAALYKNEKEVGVAIKDCIDRGIVKRNELFIVSKAPFFNPGFNETVEGFNQSLKNLGLEYIDLYLLHHPYRQYFTWQKEITKSWQGLEKVYKEGKCRSIGISNFALPHMDVLLSAAEIKPVINQLEVHPQYQNKNSVEFSINNNVQVMAWSSLNKGRIFDVKLIQDLARKYNKTPAQITLRWNLQKGNIVLVRSSQEKRIKSNFDVWDFVISESDMELIDNIPEDNYFRGQTENNVPIGIMQTLEYTNLLKFFIMQSYEREYKLFGFIPILKEKKYNRYKTKWFCLGIPILKASYKKINK